MYDIVFFLKLNQMFSSFRCNGIDNANTLTPKLSLRNIFLRNNIALVRQLIQNWVKRAFLDDQAALDEKTSVLVPCFRYKFTCKGEAEDFFWANDTIIGSSQKQGEMLVNAVNGSTDSIFGSEFLK